MTKAAQSSQKFNQIPVQLEEPEFNQFVLPHLSLPKRGPRCKIGYHRAFNLILQVLYTGMQWKELPIPKRSDGKPEIHYTGIFKLFARWSDDDSLANAFVGSVRHLADNKKLDLSVLHGDGSNTVAKKGATGSATRVTNTSGARRWSPSAKTTATSLRPSRSRRSTAMTQSC